jgi:hypothetical protein
MKLSELNIYDIGNKIGLVGAVFGDEHSTYLALFPDQEIKDNQEVLDLDTEDWKKLLRQTDLLEVEVLQHTEHGKMSKAILRKTQRLIEARISWNVFRRDGYTCRYCGRNDVPLTVDHLVLWEEGGPSIEENLVAACKKCNKTRGMMQYADWLESPYYKRVSKDISLGGIDWQLRNQKLVATLDAIPRNTHQRSRGKKKR